MAAGPSDLLGCFFLSGLPQQTGCAAAHLNGSGVELALGILQFSISMMKTVKNLTDWAGVPSQLSL